MSENILVLEIRGVSSPIQHIARLKPGTYTVGRDPSCDIVISDPYVSRRHARIFYRDNRWYIEDLGSRNGTYVNSEDIRNKGAVELEMGMSIVVGLTTIIVKGFERS